MRKRKVSVKIETKRKEVGGYIPSIAEQTSWYREGVDILTPMIKVETASVVDIESAFTKRALETYVGRTPKGLNIGSDIGCSGAKVQVTTSRVYRMEQGIANSPADFNRIVGRYPRILLVEDGKNYHVATMRGDREHGLGRAGGPTGWDTTRNMFAFALTSFTHNFQALLGVFSSRPTLPSHEVWTLPNFVYDREIVERERKYNSHIVSPPYAVPPASYKYSFALPTPLIILAVGIKCDEDTTVVSELWDKDKKSLIEPQEVTFPKGESETSFIFRAEPLLTFREGYFNINPEKPMCVSYVGVDFPPL